MNGLTFMWLTHTIFPYITDADKSSVKANLILFVVFVMRKRKKYDEEKQNAFNSID